MTGLVEATMPMVEPPKVSRLQSYAHLGGMEIRQGAYLKGW